MRDDYKPEVDKEGFPVRKSDDDHPTPMKGSDSVDLCLQDVQELDASDLVGLGTVSESEASEIFVSQCELSRDFTEAGQLVDDIVLKKYLTRLNSLAIVPLAEDLKNLSKIRFFRIKQMVYQKDEPSIPKFASVFNAAQQLNCLIYLLVVSNGAQTEFYMGIKGLDNKRTIISLKETVRHALSGQFPGVKIEEVNESETLAILEDVKKGNNIASVSCIPQEKEATDGHGFVQGLEKYIMAMQGHSYSMIVLAKATGANQLDTVRNSYENIYAALSPFATMQISYGQSLAETISQSLSNGMSSGSSESESASSQWSKTENRGESVTSGRSDPDKGTNILRGIASTALTLGSLLAVPMTGGLSIAASVGLNMLLAGLTPGTATQSHSQNFGSSSTQGGSSTKTYTETRSTSRTETESTSHQTGESRTVQLTRQNKVIQDTLLRIDGQLKRVEQCESQGMWESAAYFLSENRATVEMAAFNYRALMAGENSGLETSAINLWPSSKSGKVAELKDYLCNFLHPMFIYRKGNTKVPVTAASLISSRELALSMGLPRSSVRGLPVIEHAEFGLEPLHNESNKSGRTFNLGKIHSMGSDTDGDLALDVESMPSHTFVCGSTGAGKSNTVYEIIQQLGLKGNIPFLVIEPVKGEYKHTFGQVPGVEVFGTNPQKFRKLLRFNPFSFPAGIHVLEHLDRVVEVFNVAWPMYAAMPAVLKDALERAYITKGWDLEDSTNPYGEVFPTFSDLLQSVEKVIAESNYSSDTQGDYRGALSIRIRSLTTGLNGLLFSGRGNEDVELFDHNAIVDLSRIGSVETKSLLMGLLLTRLTEYRMANIKPGQPLRHITVLEEAHNLLKRTSTEQFMESANPVGKAVELLANSIAEMRAYGEAFIIVDQSPNMVDQSAIRNTNTKIILRLPDQSDRELVGKSANLNDRQIDELARLEKGVAAVYQNGWIQPVLARIDKCELEEGTYDPGSGCSLQSSKKKWQELLNFLMANLVASKIPTHLGQIEKILENMPLPGNLLQPLRKILDKLHNGLVPSPADKELLGEVCGIAIDKVRPGIYAKIETIIESTSNCEEINRQLILLLEELEPNASPLQLEALAQCTFLALAINNPHNQDLKNIYLRWREYRKRHAL